MKSNHQLVLGLGLIVAGLVIVGVSNLVVSSDVFLGLVLLLLIPLAISFCGAVVAFIGLLRTPENASRFRAVRRIIGLAAIAGVGLGLGFPALGILSQLQDYAAGLNGAFISGSSAGFGAYFLVGAGLLAGLCAGVLVALVWWVIRGRILAPQPAS